MRMSPGPGSALVASLLSLGCVPTSDLKATKNEGDIVRTFTQGSGAGNANVYWFPTQSGPIVVDVPLSIGDGEKMRGRMPHPYRIYITAPDPVRFGSLDIVRKPDVPAYTSKPIAGEMESYASQRLATYRKHVDDVPRAVQAPTPAVEEFTQDVVGDVNFDVIPLGPGQSSSSLAIFLPKSGELIAGDLISNHEHLDLTWGRTAAWQERLNELKGRSPRRVYPGHGRPGGPELIEESLAYLKFVHDAVAAKAAKSKMPSLTRSDAAEIKKAIMAAYPTWGRTELIDRSINAVYAVQTNKGGGIDLPAATAGPSSSDAPDAKPEKVEDLSDILGENKPKAPAPPAKKKK